MNAADLPHLEPEVAEQLCIDLCVNAARVYAELTALRVMADAIEHVQRFAEGLASNPADSELHEIGNELQAIVGEL